MASFNEHPKFDISKEQLAKCMPHATKDNIDRFYEPLKLAMSKYGIDNKYRVAAFLAQGIHETMSLRYLEEIASGEAYEGRKDLGNIYPGDGVLTKGRGFFMITGRFMYELVGKELNYNFIANPNALEKPGAASLSAGVFWEYKGLGRLADIDAFEKISARVNGINRKTGKPNHWQERIDIYNHIKKVLNIPE